MPENKRGILLEQHGKRSKETRLSSKQQCINLDSENDTINLGTQ